MDLMALLDGPSAAIVCIGTLAATVLRCGASDCRAALGALCRSRFDPQRARAELAVQVQDIRRDGLLRAEPHRFGDREFDEATDALIGTRSLAALLDSHESHKARRRSQSERAVRTLAQAAELSPVFGMVGTLVSLSQLASAGSASGQTAPAIGMAVLSTLYGVLMANIVLAPMARGIERTATTEEAERQQLVDWLATQVAPVLAERKRAA